MIGDGVIGRRDLKKLNALIAYRRQNAGIVREEAEKYGYATDAYATEL